MKFFTATALFAIFATSATAQQAFIGSPADGFQVSPGQSFNVRVDRPNFQSSAKEVAIVLGFKNCGSNGCLTPDNGIGTELYLGPFNPQYDNPSGSTPPHQNYNVTIPEWAAKGPAMLSLVHYSLIGAGLMPWMESKSISLTVV